MSLDLESILDNLQSVPSLPMTAIKLSQILSDPDSSMGDIAEVIQYDQSLTAELLKLCNSAFFGFTETITTVKDASVRLGTAKVFQIVMASSSRNLLNREIEGYQMPMGYLWKQSIGAAIASSKICRLKNAPYNGIAFTSGLLLDIGKIVLNTYVGEQMEEIRQKVENENITFNAAEKLVFGMDHQEIGAKLAESWNLPEEFVNCIRYHHEPDEAPEDCRELIYFVHLGDMFAINLGFGLGVDGMHYGTSLDVTEKLGIDRMKIDLLCSEIYTEFMEVQKLFDS